jgi:cobalamin biosynthesis protein CobT
MIEPKDELEEEEDLPDPGDPLDEGEEEGDLEESESEDLEDLSVEQLLERDRVLEKDFQRAPLQAAGDELDEENPEEPGRPAASPAPTRREELKKRYPRSPGLWS